MKRKFKKLGIAVVLAFALTFSLVLQCNAAQKVEVVNDGEQLIVNINGKQVNCDQPPYTKNNCTMVPVSIIAKELGAKVYWDPKTMTVTIKGEKVVVLTIGSAMATINGSPTTLQTPATITGGRTMVPLRFVSEALGVEVVYTKVGKTVSKDTALNMKVQEIIAKIIKPNMQDIDKAFAIFQYIRNNSLYGYGPHSKTAHGNLIDGVSVNEGYADAFHALCDAAALENYVVNGRIGGFPHAWNIVKIGDHYYHIDLVFYRNPDLPIVFQPKNDQQMLNDK